MIKIKIIFNTLLIILIIYFLIEYLKSYFYQNIKNESFTLKSKKIKRKKNKKNKKVRFNDNIEYKILDKSQKNLDINKFTENIENYENNENSENKIIKEEFSNEDKNLLLKPYNFFTTDDNVVNFQSNITKLSDYYDYNLLNEKQELTPSNYNYLNIKNKENEIIDTVSKQPLYLDKGSNGKYTTNNYWKYENEVPMCGGNFGNVVGYDTLDAAYSVYDEKKLSSSINQINDLRNGMN